MSNEQIDNTRGGAVASGQQVLACKFNKRSYGEECTKLINIVTTNKFVSIINHMIKLYHV